MSGVLLAGYALPPPSLLPYPKHCLRMIPAQSPLPKSPLSCQTLRGSSRGPMDHTCVRVNASHRSSSWQSWVPYYGVIVLSPCRWRAKTWRRRGREWSRCWEIASSISLCRWESRRRYGWDLLDARKASHEELDFFLLLLWREKMVWVTSVVISTGILGLAGYRLKLLVGIII